MKPKFEVFDKGMDPTEMDHLKGQGSSNGECFNHHSCSETENSQTCTNTSVCGA